MQRLVRAIILVSVGFIFSCSDSAKEEVNKDSQDVILGQVLPVLFNKTVPVIANKEVIVFYNIKRDSILYWALEDTSLISEEAKKYREDLILTLSSEFKISNYTNDSNDSHYFAYENQEVDSILKNHMENVIGMASIRNIVLDDEAEKGYFIYSPQLGEYKGGGVFLVAVQKEKNNRWGINNIDTLLLGE